MSPASSFQLHSQIHMLRAPGSRVSMEQFTFFLATTLKFSQKMAHGEYNKGRLTGRPSDDRFQNASKKKP